MPLAFSSLPSASNAVFARVEFERPIMAIVCGSDIAVLKFAIVFCGSR